VQSEKFHFHISILFLFGRRRQASWQRHIITFKLKNDFQGQRKYFLEPCGLLINKRQMIDMMPQKSLIQRNLAGLKLEKKILESGLISFQGPKRVLF